MSLEKFQKFEKLANIPPALFVQNDIKCVMVDMDNTLLVWRGEKIAPDEVRWCREVMSLGIKIVIVSNAVKHRTQDIAGQLGIDYIAPAAKPLPFGFIKAARQAGVKRTQCIMIGDQMMTDKVGANFAGIKFILVEPMSDVEFGMTKLNRRMEKLFFKRDARK
jgi:hypothetical protein